MLGNFDVWLKIEDGDMQDVVVDEGFIILLEVFGGRGC